MIDIKKWINEGKHVVIKGAVNSSFVPTWSDAIENINKCKHNSRYLDNLAIITNNASTMPFSNVIIDIMKTVSDNVTAHCYISLLETSRTFGKHCDNSDVLFLMCEGLLEFSVWDPSEIKYTMERGDILFIPRGMWHLTKPLSPRFGISYGIDYPDLPHPNPEKQISRASMSRILAWNIYTTKLDIPTLEISKEIYKLVEKSPMENCGKTTYRLHPKIKDMEVFKPLVNGIILHTKRYVKTDVCITQMWATVSSNGNYHSMHTHGSSLVSGVFYVNIPKGNFSLKFFNNTVNYFEKIHIEPIETNKLILFEGWMQHGFDPIEGIENKIAIAFNLDRVHD
jgi:uncharacterized protein (TIGR02466 family)